ncbi:hypothetical protein SUGI_0958100 [Cryptomeria japonica]|uniref:cytochrome P450 71AU50-like n=1 Tax=Cryptomeria japonica TaxID=3369 RepID=UPI002414B8BC|nr:cytochrome P450 71AU50-like [Cryptomeria japonica]GLJ45498.1 hypothetical protein SUGI_0958100 [Cryptomeria japonica]
MGESESSKIQVSRLSIKAIILDMLLAGVDTSLITIEWAMTELLRNPKVMARAQQEIELQVWRDRIVRESDLVNLDYLRCVMKETFRLHPVGAFMVPHQSTEGCNVGGYYIPPNKGGGDAPGMSMGSSVVHLAVAQLIHCFDWSVEGEVNREEEFGLSLPKKFPLSSLPSWRLTTEGPP